MRNTQLINNSLIDLLTGSRLNFEKKYFNDDEDAYRSGEQIFREISRLEQEAGILQIAQTLIMLQTSKECLVLYDRYRIIHNFNNFFLDNVYLDGDKSPKLLKTASSFFFTPYGNAYSNKNENPIYTFSADFGLALLSTGYRNLVLLTVFQDHLIKEFKAAIKKPFLPATATLCLLALEILIGSIGLYLMMALSLLAMVTRAFSTVVCGAAAGVSAAAALVRNDSDDFSVGASVVEDTWAEEYKQDQQQIPQRAQEQQRRWAQPHTMWTQEEEKQSPHQETQSHTPG